MDFNEGEFKTSIIVITNYLNNKIFDLKLPFFEIITFFRYRNYIHENFSKFIHRVLFKLINYLNYVLK